MQIGKKQEMAVHDLAGLPTLQIAALHGRKEVVTKLVEQFPLSVQHKDHVSDSPLANCCNRIESCLLMIPSLIDGAYRTTLCGWPDGREL